MRVEDTRIAGSPPPGTLAGELAAMEEACDGADEVRVVVASVAGDEFCSLRSRSDSTVAEFISALEHALGKQLDDCHVLVHGTHILGGRAGEAGSCQPFLGASIADEEAVQLTLVLRQKPAVRQAIAVLQDSDHRRSVLQLRTGLRTLGDLGTRGDPESVEAVVAFLRRQETNTSLRRAAIEALEGLTERGNQHAIEAVVALLSEADPHIRERALQALGMMAEEGDRRVIEAVARLLSDAEPFVRDHALHALELVSERGNQCAIEALVARLGDSRAFVRGRALQAFEKIAEKGDQDVIEAAAARLDDSDSYVRCRALLALGQIAQQGDQHVIKAVADQLSDTERVVQNAAQDALQTLLGSE